MTIRKAMTVVSGRKELLPTADRLTNVGSSWNGVTVRNNSEYDHWFGTGTTDSTGRITVNLTKDGTATGIAIFSAIHHANAICNSSSTTLANLPSFFIETISANLKQMTVRGISASTQGFAKVGCPAMIAVWGLPL